MFSSLFLNTLMFFLKREFTCLTVLRILKNRPVTGGGSSAGKRRQKKGD